MKNTMGAFALVIAASYACFGQTVPPGKLRLNGVGLGSTHSEVVKALGKPVKETKPVREECTGGREKSAIYRGASFQFMDGDSEDGKTFEVVSFEVTSAAYSVSGIRVGDTQFTVRRVLGTKFTRDTGDSPGTTVWTFEIGEKDGPGFTNVTFRKGKVVSISSAYAVC